jgi:hypothetical protein
MTNSIFGQQERISQNMKNVNENPGEELSTCEESE